jgi:hypothetical protein
MRALALLLCLAACGAEPGAGTAADEARQLNEAAAALDANGVQPAPADTEDPAP